MKKNKGSSFLVMAIISAMMTSIISLSLAKVNQLSNSSFNSSRIAMQSQSIADSKMNFLSLGGYNGISAQNRKEVNGTSYFDSVVVGTEIDVGEGVTSKDVTVNVFHSNEASPRYRLTKTFYSNGNSEYVFNDNDDAARIGLLYSGSRIIARLDNEEQKLLTSITPVISNSNLNNLTETGFFNGTSLGNAPSSGWFYIENIRCSNMSNSYVDQKATAFDTGKIYHRQCRNGAWSAWNEVGSGGGVAFAGWTDNFASSGTAPADGIICAKSKSNTIVSITTSGVERVYTAKRDKYGQGCTSITCPVKKGETYSVSGATYIRFMKIGN